MSEKTTGLLWPPFEAIPVLVRGCGPTAFINNAAHMPQMAATFHFKFVGAAPVGADECDWMSRNYKIPPTHVTTDYRDLLKRAYDETEGKCVLLVTTPTLYHTDSIAPALEIGFKDVILDKPFTPRLKEGLELAALFEQYTARAFITFCHRYLEEHLLQKFWLKKLGVNKVRRILAWFLQEWLRDTSNLALLQAVWRTKDPEAALTDIGVHIFDLVCWILGQEPISVSGAKLVTNGTHDLKFHDTGSVNVHFPDDLVAELMFTQASTRQHKDDIGAAVECDGLPEGAKALMGRMNWGTDMIWVTNKTGVSPHQRKHWKSFVRNIDPWWPADSGGTVKQPPGHVVSWPEGWFKLEDRVALAIYEARGMTFADVPAKLREFGVPGLADCVRHMRFANATIASAQEGGAEVKLAEAPVELDESWAKAA